MASLPLRLLLVSGLALATLACGDDEATGRGSPPGESAGQGGSDDAAGDGGDGGDGGDSDDCSSLELGRRRLFHNAFGELTGVSYPLREALGDPALPDYLLIELYDSTTPTETGFLPPLEAGDFDLTDPPDILLTTCQHCVALVIDVVEGTDPFGLPIFQPARHYYARSGSMSLDEVHDPLNLGPENSALLGSIDNVELAEVDLDDPAVPFVDGSGCFSVPETTFDTRPTPGADCEDLDDCGNELLEVCDPATLSCLDEVQCHIDMPCAGNAYCIQQSPLTFQGACYPACTPFASGSCPEDQTCVQYGLSEQLGYCLWSGETAVGDECAIKDAKNACSGDAVCEGGTCLEQCGFFSGDPDCPASSACDVLGHCLSPDVGDPAALGEACQDGAELASPCAPNGRRFDGICFTYDGAEAGICGKSCFVDADDYTDGNADDGADDPDCSPDSFCALRFSSGLGICLPDPVCGDGDFGEVGEACDDGNLDSEDGCSADCQTVEYGPLCAAAAELAVDDSVEGDTLAGVDGFQASCQLGLSRGVVYSVSPPGPGQLELSVTSETIQVVSLRSDCAAAESELACGYSLDGPSLVLQLAETGGAPLTVLVNAYTVLEAGPFTLTAEFTPQVCGDGLVVGGEACDDGNTDSDDGCNADCTSIEYDYFCDNAEVLPLNVNVSGELGGQASLYSPSCGYGEGPDKLYRITAAEAGTLTVSLDQTAGAAGYVDLALFALDGCGAPGSVTELACSSVYDPAEVLTLSVTKNQTVFIVVDGQENAAAEYTLSAELE